MTDRKLTVNYYEIEDGSQLVIEFYNREDNLEKVITMERRVAQAMAKGIMELLGDY